MHMTKITIHTCPYKGFRHITVGADTSSYTAKLLGKCWSIFYKGQLIGATPTVRRIEFIIAESLKP